MNRMGLTTNHIQHLQKVWEQVINNGAIEGDPRHIRDNTKFGTHMVGGYRQDPARARGVYLRYKSTAEVLEVLYPLWQKRTDIETHRTEHNPEEYTLKLGGEIWTYKKKRQPSNTQKEAPQLLIE